MIRKPDKNSVVIGVDSSTTATKAVAWDAAGQVVAVGRCPMATDSPQSGWAQQDPQAWWESTITAVAQCVAGLDGLPVAALGLTVQRETFALLGAAGEPLHAALLWHDARAQSELAAVAAQVGVEDYHRTTGKQLDVTSAVAKMCWLRRHTGLLGDGNDARFVDVMAYLALRMTDRSATTPAGLDTTGLLELRGGAWHEPHLRMVGLEAARMPALVPPGGLLGNLTASAAAALGLSAGTPLVAGGGDGHCFAFGARVLCGDGLAISLGTSAVLSVEAATPVLGDAFRTLIGCEAGTFYLESVLQCGTATVDWLNRTFPGGGREPVSLREADAEAARLPVGSEGLLVLPHWRGVRVPRHDATARGVVLGWHDRHTQAHFHRAIMEGIALEMAALAADVAARAGVTSDRLAVGGGGAVSDLWCQILADALNRPCWRADTVEVAAFGAAELARRFIAPSQARTAPATQSFQPTVFQPDAGRAAQYAAIRPLLPRLYAGTRDVQADLDRLLLN